ncbi:MAG: permease [Alphaproteobacteria bacterium]
MTSDPLLSPADRRRFTTTITTIIVLWFAAVVITAESGFLSSLWRPLIAALVAASIALPTLWYFASPKLQAYMAEIGHRPILIFHIWRIPAGLMFFWFGYHNQLPPAFWMLAGTGDLAAGSYAAWLARRVESAASYRSFHVFGFADFVTAVGTGLVFTLFFVDQHMVTITVLPMALVPLFGVGISGVTHLIAFDMLRKGVGFKGDPGFDKAVPRTA